MYSALIFLSASTFFLTVLTVLFKIEDSFGDRLILGRFRKWLDGVVIKFRDKIRSMYDTSISAYVRLTWHYILHNFLKKIISSTIYIQHWLESVLQKNKAATKKISNHSVNNDSHLGKIAEHKAKTALSESEKEQRKAH